MAEKRKGFGDEQGTRIGKPEGASRPTGAGSEASEGIHGADGNREEGDRTSLDGKDTGTDAGSTKAGSEPIDSHDEEHESGYGGRGGTPKP